MSEDNKPTNFHITKEADLAAKEIIKHGGNLSTSSELALLGIALIINKKDKSHLSIEDSMVTVAGGVHKGRLNDLENHEGIALIYEQTFEEPGNKDIWKNFQKAASAGIILIKESYFTSQNLIDWEAINKDFL